MTHVMVIGGGLAGLAAARTAAKTGARVSLLVGGQGVHHMFSGCVDLLGFAPDGDTLIQRPLDAVAALKDSHPGHPYAIAGVEAVRAALSDFTQDMQDGGLTYVGDGRAQHAVTTVSGHARPTALVPATMDTDPARIDAVCNLDAFPNFSAALLAAELGQTYGRRVAALNFESGSGRRDAIGLAGLLDQETFVDALADFLKTNAPGQIVAIPALLGWERVTPALARLEAAFGGRLIEVPGQPPSLPGLRLFTAYQRLLLDAGVRLVRGARAVTPVVRDGRLAGLHVAVRGVSRVEKADAFVLAAGHLISGGIVGERHGLVEPLFDLPVIGGAGATFFGARFLQAAGHPAMRAGVAIDETWRPVGESGPAYDNLFACGDILAHFDPYRERSGGGVALVSGALAGQRAAEAAS